MSISPHLRALVREFRARPAEFFGALGCMGISSGLYLLLPRWGGRLVSEVLPSGDSRALARCLGLGLAAFAGASLFGFGRYYLMMRLSHRAGAALRERLLRAVLAAPLRRSARLSGAELLSRFSHDLQVFQTSLNEIVAVFVPGAILALCFGAAMLYYSWPLTLLALLVVSPVGWTIAALYRRLHRATHQAQSRLAALVARFEEAVAGLRDIKAFGREDAFARRFARFNEDSLAALLREEKTHSFHPTAVALTTSAGVAALIFAAAAMARSGAAWLADVTAFLVCLGIAYGPMQDACRSAGQLSRLFAVMDRCEEILGLPPEAPPGQALPEMPPIRGAIAFEGVGFAYEPGGFELRGIEFAIAPGEFVALAGPSGSGKSTLLDFIPRFLDPQAGRVAIDGLDIARFSLDSLRRQIAFVPQEPVLFEGTLRENLSLGAPEAGDAEIEHAARAAHAAEFADRLSAGYDSPIGPRGAGLSVGQRQRIAIARALLANPRILLLDEPTSALDPKSEALICDTLRREAGARTILVVAHRDSLIAAADRVLEIRDGHVRERAKSADGGARIQ
ncbi:MAG: putative multidrug export ATP-binding/permease protein [candidate division BRC1 bacterium ADurb.BinA364]|nr:MAG: putative multidrug export ATP-binding/permease protein [candidate division BRC1 bacterium ADurb.BinA364]